MPNSKTILLLAAALMLAGGCAHQEAEKDLDAKLAAENSVANRAALRKESGDLIDKTGGLTQEQRDQLHALGIETRAKIGDLRKTSLKLRSILIKDMLASSFDEEEVEAIKNKMREIGDSRLETIYVAVTKADAILGRGIAQNQYIIDNLFDERGIDRGEKR